MFIKYISFFWPLSQSHVNATEHPWSFTILSPDICRPRYQMAAPAKLNFPYLVIGQEFLDAKDPENIFDDVLKIGHETNWPRIQMSDGRDGTQGEEMPDT